jgi:hypothetical protein
MKPLNTLFFLIGLLIALSFSVPFAHSELVPWTTYSNPYYDRTCALTGGVTSLVGSGASETWGVIRDGVYTGWHDFIGQDGVYYSVTGPTSNTCYISRDYDYSPEPSTCSNGVKDGDEIGVDCGGSCTNGCECSCGEGYTLSMVSTPEGTSCECEAIVEPDKLDQCPIGYVKWWDDQNYMHCVATSDPVLVDSGLPQSESETFTSDTIGSTPSGSDGSTSDSPSSFAGGTFSVVESPTTTTTVDNGDGTSTITETTSMTSTDSTGSSTTVTRSSTYIQDNTTGEEIEGTRTTETEGDVAPEDNPENYDFAVHEDGDFSEMGISDEDKPDEEDWNTWFSDKMNNNPIKSVLDSVSVTTANSVCSFSGQVLGSTVEFSFCGDPYESTLEFMGYVLVFLSGIGAYFIVVGRG